VATPFKLHLLLSGHLSPGHLPTPLSRLESGVMLGLGRCMRRSIGLSVAIGVQNQSLKSTTPLNTTRHMLCIHFRLRTAHCSVLFFSRPRSEGWPHHGRTFSIYPCPLSFWLTLPRGVLSTSWCCPSRPCVAFLAFVHLALFLALSLSPGNSPVSSRRTACAKEIRI